VPNTFHTILLIAVAVIMTVLTRALPFLLFGGSRKMPSSVDVVAKTMPPAIMAVLVVYCVKSDLFTWTPSALATAIGVLSTVLLHLWKRNTLLSIAGGTILYMVCIHLIPGVL